MRTILQLACLTIAVQCALTSSTKLELLRDENFESVGSIGSNVVQEVRAVATAGSAGQFCTPNEVLDILSGYS